MAKATQSEQEKFTQSQEKTEVNVAVIQNDIGYIKAKMEEINKKFDLMAVQYVTRSEFQVVRMVVYGMCGAALLAIAYTLLSSIGLKVR